MTNHLCFDRCLNVTYIKRDEGFESDGSDHSDNANANAAALALAANSGSSNSVEEKIIKDHAVFVRDGTQSHKTISYCLNYSVEFDLL